MRFEKVYKRFITGALVLSNAFFLYGQDESPDSSSVYEPTSTPTFEHSDRYGNPYAYPNQESPYLLNMPNNYRRNITIDDSLKTYYIEEKVGSLDYRPSTTMTFEEFEEWQKEQQIRSYWSEINSGDPDESMNSSGLNVKLPLSPTMDRIFGGNYVDIRPNGSVTLSFGGRWQRNFNPSFTKQQQRYGGFDFDQNIALNMVGKVGEKLKLNINWNSNATFEFDNMVKIDYTGMDYEILQDIEAGNVSLPMKSALIQGGQNLFGFKTVMKFGRLDVTSVISQQRGSYEEMEFKNGSQTKELEIEGADYEMNKHYFLADFFRDNYEQALQDLPRIITNVNITRLEVYIRNKQQQTQGLRNFAAFTDLGDRSEGNIPNNKSTKNNLYAKLLNNELVRNADDASSVLQSGEFSLEKSNDFEVIRQARKLIPGQDYDFHPQLGYVSLKSALQNDDVLAVAFEFTYNGRKYKVGELSEDYQNREDDDVIFLKLLRPATVDTKHRTWDLMMKNVYSLRSSRINQENFRLQVIYKNDKTGLDNPALQEGPFKDVNLLEVMNLDNVNMNGDKQPDGNFDFLDLSTGANFSPLTIDIKNGRIYFPVLEPFGENLEKRFVPAAQYSSLINKYVFNEMYDGTKSDALQLATKNKYFIKVAYQSASSKDIQLNAFDLDPGSVTVTVGSTVLQEGADYEVNYGIGKIKIKNEGILNSGKTIKVRYEKKDFIQQTPRTFFGSRLDYNVNKNFVIGGTILRLTERPWWKTVRQGFEPSNSTIWGTDINYSTESRFLTKLVDKIPLIQTKVPSNISVSGEFAHLIPSHSKHIEINGEATAYIDDFEGSETPYYLSGTYAGNKKWELASTPSVFPEAKLDNYEYSRNRAKLNWYTLDQSFLTNRGGQRPDHITEEDLQNSYVRNIVEQQIFPNKDPNSYNNQLLTMDLAYYPAERGPYNYDTENLNPDGTFTNPKERWAGISRAVEFDTDFDNANIAYVEFWLMDPFADTIKDGSFDKLNSTGGKMILNLGNVSEDVMKDNRFFFENGLPLTSSEETDSTIWGKVPSKQYLTNGFDNAEGARAKQDLGYDGLNDSEERTFFSDFLSSLPPTLTTAAKSKLESDPSNDNFRFFLNSEYDREERPIVGRYKDWNGFENNSPEGATSQSYSTLPEKEDLNSDNTVSDLESYYQYEMELVPGGLTIGNNYIVDEVLSEPSSNDNWKPIKWYQFRIPIRDVGPENAVGNISNFKSIRFVRLYLTGWEEPIVLRMANFQYVASQWRAYTDDLKGSFVGTPNHDENTIFNISSVNIEENGSASGDDIPYVVPDDEIRQLDLSSNINRQQNEQSIKLCVDNLQVDDGRAVFKNVGLDFINYKKLRLYVHAEAYPESVYETDDFEVSTFVRFGTDFTQNYYEVEVPLVITRPGASARSDIWPSDNEIDVNFGDLVDLKKERPTEYIELGKVFEKLMEDDSKIRIQGRPDLSDVRVIMLGIKNVPEGYDANDNPIGSPKSVCLWLDELRMTGFDEYSGWAALGSVKTKLADLATVNLSGRHEHMGFGSLGQNFNQRARENTTSYDVNSTIALNKFLPKKLNVSLPMYVGYDQTRVVPRYDPLNPDVLMKDALELVEDRKVYENQVLDITRNKSINFTNIKKNKAPGKKGGTPLDISNFAFTYAYSESNQTNINTAVNSYKTRRGALNYDYKIRSLSIEPFAKSKAFKSKWLKLIKKVNLTPFPTNISFRAELNRTYRETQYRTVDFAGNLTTDGFSPFYEKNFTFKRDYSVRWPITKGLSFDYTANAMSKIDERAGRIDKEDEDYEEKMNIILNNMKDFGRVTDFNQTGSLTYKVPLNLLPLTDWINVNLKYSANYNWLAGPVVFDDQGIASTDSLGNSIQNSNNKSINGNFNLEKLYNKVKYLRKINNPPRTRRGSRTSGRRGKDKSSGKDEEEEEDKKKKKKDSDSQFNPVKTLLRLAMSVRNVNFSYTENQGTMLPGYMGSIKYFGLDEDFMFPGVPFIAGIQDDSIQYELAANGLISKSNLMTQPLKRTSGYNLNLRANVEPFDDFKIQLTAKQDRNDAFSAIFKDTIGNSGIYSELAPMYTGSYSCSFVGVRTFFQSIDSSDNYMTGAYQQMIEGRETIKRKLDSYNDNTTVLGEYGLNSQEVLLGSFLTSYRGKETREFDPRKGNKNIFLPIPLPNWNISYRGLSKVGFIKKWFSSFSLQHAYTGSYRVSNFITSLDYVTDYGNEISSDKYYKTDITNENNEFVSYYVIDQIMISENMSPLIGVSMKTRKSNMNIKLSYDKSRDISMMVSNAQLTEVRSDKLNFTFGWVKEKWKLPKVFGYIFNKGRDIVLPNEVNFKMSLSVSDNTTLQRNMDGETQATAGMYSLQLKPTVDYEYSKKINVQLYFGRTINSPKVSTSFKNTMTEGGFRVRISL